MKGYKVYKHYKNIKLIENGFDSYSTKKNTQLGKLIANAQNELKNCLVWYRVKDKENGSIEIIYKEL